MSFSFPRVHSLEFPNFLPFFTHPLHDGLFYYAEPYGQTFPCYERYHIYLRRSYIITHFSSTWLFKGTLNFTRATYPKGKAFSNIQSCPSIIVKCDARYHVFFCGAAVHAFVVPARRSEENLPFHLPRSRFVHGIRSEIAQDINHQL